MTTGKTKQQGFTLTELMFAMAFVAFIMLFIVGSVIQIMRTYNKGISIRQIDQSGRQLSEELTRTLRYANAVQFASVNTNAMSTQRICANGVTYVWNLQADTSKNTYQTPIPTGTPPIRFIRVDDKTGSLCTSPTSKPLRSMSKDLLSDQLAVSGLTMQSEAGGKVIVIQTTISTGGNNLPLSGRPTPTGFECPQGVDGSFCAFGQFSTTVYIRN